MNPQDAVDLGRDALLSGFFSIVPLLLIGLGIALLIGIIQSMFQIQETSVAVIPKLLLMLLVLVLLLPWLSERMVDLGRSHFQSPLLIGGMLDKE
ncbi:MAG: flagellar biosynthetic protein FliQ [Pirellulaceae bacterium]|jgi:flagellar biosynthesis protein FliQ|nr:flagellar biosynthetic protein FliQ [Pirellulaceae bacterium]